MLPLGVAHFWEWGPRCQPDTLKLTHYNLSITRLSLCPTLHCSLGKFNQKTEWKDRLLLKIKIYSYHSCSYHLNHSKERQNLKGVEKIWQRARLNPRKLWRQLFYGKVEHNWQQKKLTVISLLVTSKHFLKPQAKARPSFVSAVQLQLKDNPCP